MIHGTVKSMETEIVKVLNDIHHDLHSIDIGLVVISLILLLILLFKNCSK